MKKNLHIYILALLTSLLLSGCEKDEYDGMFNIDPTPDAVITFPEALAVDGKPLMEQNAFIISQNSIANGQVKVVIEVPSKHQITELSIIGQRYRAPLPDASLTGLLTPQFSTAAAVLRAPASGTAFNRITGVYNVGVNVPVATVGSRVEYSFPLAEMPATLLGTLGDLQVNDVIRFAFKVKLADGSTHVSTEVRVVVKG
jgi:hypothetical protein